MDFWFNTKLIFLSNITYLIEINDIHVTLTMAQMEHPNWA